MKIKDLIKEKKKLDKQSKKMEKKADKNIIGRLKEASADKASKKMLLDAMTIDTKEYEEMYAKMKDIMNKK